MKKYVIIGIMVIFLLYETAMVGIYWYANNDLVKIEDRVMYLDNHINGFDHLISKPEMGKEYVSAVSRKRDKFFAERNMLMEHILLSYRLSKISSRYSVANRVILPIFGFDRRYSIGLYEVQPNQSPQ